MEFGIKKSKSPQKRIKQLGEMVSVINVLPFGTVEAKFAAQIRYQLERLGRLIGPYDILIAATAIANNSPVVTHNIDEFSRIKDLRVIDWY